MDEEIRDLLGEEIASEIRELAQISLGSKEYEITADNLVKLYRLRIDENKNAAEIEEKKNQLAEQKKDRYLRIGLGVAELLLPLIFYGTWMKKGFKFEETGTFTSTTFRGLFNRFRPTKR